MNNKLYITNPSFTNAGSMLHIMDPITLSLKTLGSILDENWTVNGLGSNDEVLYGWAVDSSENDPSLVSINKETGKGKIIGKIGIGPIKAITVSDKGIIYGIGGEAGALEFITIDASTGVHKKLGTLFSSIKSIGGLTFDSVGNLYALIYVKDASAPGNNGTYLSPVDTRRGVVNIGYGMKFTDNSIVKNVNCISYLGFSLYGGGTSLSNIYNIEAPAGKISLIGEPNTLNDIIIYGMTASS